MQEPKQAELPWWFFPGIGLSCAVSAVWAVEAVACGGLIAGALGALITLCIHALVSLDVTLVVGALFAAGAGAGGLLAAHPWFRPRRELLFFLLPVASLLIGGAVAMSGWIRFECSLGPWTPSRKAAVPAWLYAELMPPAQALAGVCPGQPGKAH